MKAPFLKIVSTFIFFYSCQAEIVLPQLHMEESRLINVIHYENFSKEILGAIARGVLSKSTPYEFHDVEAVKIIYKTNNFDGEEIASSGILLLPKINERIPMLSFQHGEVVRYIDAPSQSTTGPNDLTSAAIIASTGVAVAIADYIGYGNSSLEWHPFEHKASLAKDNFDMLMASKEYLSNNRKNISAKLYLSGYSEGGMATLALHQLVEKKTRIKITETIIANGAYAKSKWTKELLKNTSNPEELRYFIRTLHSYNKIYPELQRPWHFYFKEPYVELIQQIDELSKLPDSIMHPKLLFTQHFISGVINESDQIFIRILNENQIEGWESKTPIWLYPASANKPLGTLQSEIVTQKIENAGGNIDLIILEQVDCKNLRNALTQRVLTKIHKY